MEETVKEPIALVTPTRDRAEAMALCALWMSRQTYPGLVHWIIVDDGDLPVDMAALGEVMAPLKNWRIDYVRREPSREVITLQDNLLAALERIDKEPVAAMLIIEDDEHYAPIYVEEMIWRLGDFDIVGEMKARYYNVAERRWDIMEDNTKHASLCRTGMRTSVLPAFRKVVEHGKIVSDPFIDMALWGSTALVKPPPPPPLPPEMQNRPWAAGAEWKYQNKASGAPQTSIPQIVQAVRTDFLPDDTKASLFEHRGISVGIKGMPGRGGIGRAHQAKGFTNIDPLWVKLVEWIGSDAQAYIDLAKKLRWEVAI